MSGPYRGPEPKVFNTGIKSNNPLSIVTIVEDPEEIPAESLVSAPNFSPANNAANPAGVQNAGNSAGNQLVIDVIDDKEGFLKRASDGVSHAFSGKMLYLTLALMATALTVIILAAKHGNSSTAKAESAARVMDQKSAMQARIALQNDISKTSAALIQVGYDKTEVRTVGNAIWLSRGTDIAAAARDRASPVIVSAEEKSKSTLVTGAYSPTHYQSLSAVDVNAYLDPISQKPTIREILANSAVIHGDTVQK